MSGDIRLVALVTEPEWPGLVAAAEQLSECLGAALGGAPPPVRLNLLPVDGQIAADAAPTAIIISLMADAPRVEEALDDTEARWRTRLAALIDLGAPVFLVTVFRHLSDGDRGRYSPMLERIRRLNLMAIRLSNTLGVGVIDMDRAFAHIGARSARCDWRLGGVLAAEVAGHTAALSLLTLGLDEAVDPEIQERAMAILGGLNTINTLVSRRLTQKQRAANAHG